MKTNVGNLDKTFRFLVALILIGLFFAHVITGTLAYILLAGSAVCILTGLINFCPLYLPFGFNTTKKKE